MLQVIISHSWIECIDKNKCLIQSKVRDGDCDGYTHDYPGRNDRHIDQKMTYTILPIDVDRGIAICKSKPEYYGWRHRIKVIPGEIFYFTYKPNGHIAKDRAGRGTKYGIYWTGKPREQLNLTTELTEEKLIDGKLHDFDDGQCGETFDMNNQLSGRAGDGIGCVGVLQIPQGVAPGVYELVWFWRFYNLETNGPIGLYGGAAYSSCFQVEVSSPNASPSLSKIEYSVFT